jgi:hypothetical protein
MDAHIQHIVVAIHQTDGFFAAVFEKSAPVNPTAEGKSEKVEVVTEADEETVKAERKKAAISKSKAVTKAAAAKSTAKKAAPKKAKV